MFLADPGLEGIPISQAVRFADIEALICSSPVVLYARLAQEELRFVYLSGNAGRILNLDPKDFLGKAEAWLRRIHPDDREDYLRGTQQALTKRHHLCEFRYRDDDGRWRWLRDEVRLARREGGASDRLVGSILDISLRKTAEASLIDSEEKFRAIFESSNDAVMLLTDRGFFDCNHATLEMFGFANKEDFIQAHPAELSPVRQASGLASLSAYAAYIQNAIETGISRFEWLYRRIDGDDFYAEVVLTPFSYGGESVVQATVRDISERKLAEERLRVANANLERRVRERTEELRMSNLELRDREAQQFRLMTIQRQFHGCKDRDAVYRLIPQALTSLFPASSGYVAVVDRDLNGLKIIAGWGSYGGIGPTWGKTACSFQWLPGRSTQICRGQDLSHPCDCTQAGYWCFPMTAWGEFMGLLHLDLGDGFSADLQYIAQTLTEIIALSLSNLGLHETLRDQATRDVLTGLYNRRYLEERLSGELSRLSRQADPSLCLGLIDIDYFKRFNDSYGHPAGDRVLQEVGRFLGNRLRQSDIACRYGGEEFLVVMFDSALEDARNSLEGIRKELRSLEIVHQDQVLPRVTVSIGLAEFPVHAKTADELIDIADKALYLSKRAGRDRVTVAHADLIKLPNGFVK